MLKKQGDNRGTSPKNGVNSRCLLENCSGVECGVVKGDAGVEVEAAMFCRRFGNKKGAQICAPFLCCLTWIRTKTGRTKNCSATITP